MVFLNTVFLIVFLLSAAVQLNDPDAAAWIVLYLSAAFMCAAQYRRKRSVWLPRALLLACVVWIATLIPTLWGDVRWGDLFASLGMRTRDVEEAREIGGLAIVALWSGVLSFSGARNSR